MLAESSAAILSQIGSPEQIWLQLPETARALTNMSMATVCVLEDDGISLRVVAQTGVNPPMVGQIHPLAEFPTAEHCISTGRPVTVDDIRDIEKLGDTPINRAVATKYDVRAVLQVPLIVKGRAIGVMMLGSTKPRRFTAADIRLAELWGGLAAVTIANERLFEQANLALAEQKKAMDQRNALFAVNEAIFRGASPDVIVQRIADMAAAPLGVEACMVNMLSGNEDELKIVAISAPYSESIVGQRYRASGTNSELAMQRREIVVIEDGPDNPTLHPYMQAHLPCGSVIYAPLLDGDGKAMGLLVLLRKAAGKFSKDQLHLARLFAVRAAASLETARLYQQTRRDAETQAMLLRELNHRVKNTLAGIVALLSINAPEMPRAARQWLGRVVDRIRTIARTHETLSGGVEHLSLQGLVDQTLRSLSVVVGPDVTVRTEIEAVKLQLRSDRAISLAMVLHELCYNALVHGVPQKGHLMVRVACLDAVAAGLGKSITIEVTDDGAGFATKPEHKSEAISDGKKLERTGLGLNLVRDFVNRELRGEFVVNSVLGKGTTALVRFPLLDGEW